MTKSDLIQAIAEKAGVSKKSAGAMIDAFTDTVLDAAHSAQPVVIHGFGTFSRKDKPSRNARNPKTGGAIVVQAYSTLSFKPVPSVKEKLS